MLRSMVSLIAIGSAMLMALSCDSDKKASRGKGKAAATSSATGVSTGGTDAGWDDGDDSSGDPSGACLSDGGGSYLQAAVTAEAVMAIVIPKCAACHLSDTAPGGNFNTAEGLKAKTATLKDRLHRPAGSEGAMPPGGPLTADEIATIEAWIDAGAPLPGAAEPAATTSSDPCAIGIDPNGGNTGGTVTPTPTATNTDTTDDGYGNTGVTDPGEPIKEVYETYLNPPEKDDCHAAGKPFYRDADAANPHGRCYEADYPANFECTRAGVQAAFNNNPTVVSALDQKDAEGWYYDDCGVLNGKPVVFFACYTSDGSACLKVEDVTAGELSILSALLKAQ